MAVVRPPIEVPLCSKASIVNGPTSIFGNGFQVLNLYDTHINPCASRRAIFDEDLSMEMADGEMCGDDGEMCGDEGEMCGDEGEIVIVNTA